VPYDRAVVVPPVNQALSPDGQFPDGRSPDAPPRPEAPRPGGRGAHAAAPGPVPSGPWLTALAFVVVAAPFAYAALRLATAPSAHLALPDDLALIDLHVRRALIWKQQVGVFDHNNWNHPGPAYFYLVSLAYRVLGSSARSLFVGATVLNGLAAVACIGVVRRRTTPTRALWAAVWIGVLAAVLAAAGPSATTYSETVLGALVSPWNPMVVLFPLLLLLLLCAGAVDRSGPSLVGALLVGSYVVQTDISTTPLVVALVGGAGATWAVTAFRDRRRRTAPVDAASPAAPGSGPEPAAGGHRAVVLAVVGLVALVVMWVPPVVQQFTGHPGNLGLIVRFFGASHPGQSLTASLWSVAAASTVLVVGPSEVMTSILGGTPAHAALAVAVALATLVVSAAVLVLGARRRDRFAVGTGALTLLGALAAVVAVTHVVGFIYGYLVIWAVVLPVAALIGVGTVPGPVPVLSGGSARSRATGIRVGLCAVAVVVGVVACVCVAAIPPLARVSDPRVARLAALVEPRLVPGARVAVEDAGAGTADTQLIDLEEFIGLVNQLDRAGLAPRVDAFWRAQFGPGYITDGTESRVVGLSTWTPASPSSTGYVGRVGDMAVTVTDRSGAAAPVTG